MCVVTEKELLGASHILVDEAFRIDLSHNQIIWAPNGTAKSTICNELKQREGFDRVEFADLDDSRSDFIKNKNKLTISAGVVELEQKRDKLKKLEDKTAKDIRERLKCYGITDVATANRFLPGLEGCRSTNKAMSVFEKFDFSAGKELAEKLDSSEGRFFVENRLELKQTRSQDLAADVLASASVFHALEVLFPSAGDFQVIDRCPICDGEINEPIASLIKRRMQELKDQRNALWSNYCAYCESLGKAASRDCFEDMCNLADLPTTTDIAVYSYCLMNGTSDNGAELESTRTRLSQLKKEIEEIERKGSNFFKELQAKEAELRSMFENRFKATNVVFNQEKYSLEITLPRDAAKYSTGEISLMMTLVKLTAFEAGDKEELVFDDPVSSYDKANQYVVMFYLTKLAKRKHVTVFTHNLDCFGIANSQNKGVFKHYYMDRIDRRLLFGSFSPVEGRVKVEEILDRLVRDPCNHEMICGLPADLASAYLKAVGKREDGDRGLHEVFHYRVSKSVTFEQYTLSNDELVSLIDGVDRQESRGDCDSLFARKALLVVALRVWVEKHLLDKCNKSPLDPNPEKNSLGNLIEYIFPRNSSSLWDGPMTVTREFLCSKKTMLNQNSHYDAQSDPFEYAVNLRIGEIYDEIDEIKAAFEA